MKKLLLAVFVAAGMTAFAQPHTSQDFLAVQAVYVTNLLAITNLTLNDYGTNIAGTSYTNSSGTLVTASGSTGTSVSLLKDCNLWADREGRWWGVQTNENIVNYEAPYSTANVSVKFAGGSGANAAVTFTFAPVWDGENYDSSERWTFSYTATGATSLSRSTNVPVWRWPGAKSLKCLRIVNADTDATSHVIITDLKLNGYMP